MTYVGNVDQNLWEKRSEKQNIQNNNLLLNALAKNKRENNRNNEKK